MGAMGDPFRVDIVVWGDRPGVRSTLGYQEETLSASGWRMRYADDYYWPELEN